MDGQRWWRGLLARMTLAYAIGATLLATVVAGASYGLAQNRLLTEAETQEREQFYFNAKDVRERLATITAETSEEDADTIYTAALNELSLRNGAKTALIPADGDVRSPQLLNNRDLPDELEVLAQEPSTSTGQLRYQQDGVTNYALGIRLEGVDAVYYEVLPLGDLEATLRSLRVILVAVAGVTSIGGAALGYYSARRALAPVGRIASAARAIAGGDLSTRLDLQADRDLAVLSQAFNEMVDAVGQRIEREQRFTSDVSHELRSPLMTLTASVEILERRRGSLPDVAQQAVDLLSSDLERFQRLVEDLLEISRAEAGAVQIERNHILLAEFLEQVLAQSRNAFVPLQYSTADAETVLLADKRRLAQVMTNLIENADKYGDGVAGVSFEVIDEQVQIDVDAYCQGVPVHLRERIFERFGRIDSSAGNRSEATGFGLGLSLVAEHVRLHDGSVWVTDRIDGEHGARFVVELPLGEDLEETDFGELDLLDGLDQVQGAYR